MAKRRGHGEGSIFQRFTAQITVNDPETGKSKQITICGKTSQEVQEKLSPYNIYGGKIPISQSWVTQATIGRYADTGKPKRVTFYGKTRKEVADKLTAALHEVNQGIFMNQAK